MSQQDAAPIRVGLLHPHAEEREDFVALVQAEPRLQLTLNLSSPSSLLAQLRRTQLDLLIVAEALGPSLLTRTIAEVMSEHPMALVIAADSQRPGEPPAPLAMEALRAGALTVLPGPLPSLSEHERHQLLLTLQDMSALKVVRRRQTHPPITPVREARRRPVPEVIGIAASSGGPAALHQILIELPADFPSPILVVQHFTAGFLMPFIRWLSHDTRLEIGIARHGQALEPSRVYVAPDHHHLGAHDGRIILSSDDPIGGFRPSANHLFSSLAANYGARAWGVILTGMGRDGVDGLLEMRRRGALTIAQHEQGCAVYGMPRAAWEAGAAAHALRLADLPRHLLTRQLPHAPTSL